jgi:hypothetical protein
VSNEFILQTNYLGELQIQFLIGTLSSGQNLDCQNFISLYINYN